MHADGNLQVNPSESFYADLQAVIDYSHDSTLLQVADAQRIHQICLGHVAGSTD